MNEHDFFRSLNARTDANYHKHQAQRRANRRIAYRQKRTALRHVVTTVAVDAALIGSIVTSLIVLVACAVG